MIRTLLTLLLTASAMTAAPAGFNYDEAAVPPYTLPDPLVCADGTRVESAAQWREKRRPELVRLFEEHVYGKALLGRPAEMTFKILAEKPDARGGTALRREVAVLFTGQEDGPRLTLLLHLPAKAAGPVPVLFGPNFQGNYATTAEADIPLPSHWVPNDRKHQVTANRATEGGRGGEAGRWQYDYALSQGFGVATFCYGEVDPDEDDGWKNGIHAWAGAPKAAGDWGSIGTWAWACSRGLDYLLTEPRIDAKRVCVLGHSRLGKTALWAGVLDERFALVISNQSGCGGAALSRRIFGETVKRINTSFPHWFCDNYNKYNDNEAAAPIDQHELLALIAPRPVLVDSATEDQWADPKGEFLSCAGADPVYRLLGTDGLAGVKEHPAPGQLSGGCISYFLRPGPHDVNLEDWQAYVAFARKQLK